MNATKTGFCSLPQLDMQHEKLYKSSSHLQVQAVDLHDFSSSFCNLSRPGLSMFKVNQAADD